MEKGIILPLELLQCFSNPLPRFTPLEIMPRCSAAGLDFRIIPAGFNAPLGFESQRLEFLTGFTVQPEILRFSGGFDFNGPTH